MKVIQIPLPEIDMTFLGPVDPISILSPFRNSLENLKVPVVQVGVLPTKEQYPLVTTLILIYCDHTELWVLQHYFPDLRELAFQVGGQEGEGDMKHAKIEDKRQRNFAP